ncbi:MAG TPA: ABC transporter ATP-binding protein [Bacillota bacterium]|nr:ABC transporter ATP-binding protein [Bacillota bacterium]HOG53366.1 ABC transporter ATP-binding protein [Bacillota bacterium]
MKHYAFLKEFLKKNLWRYLAGVIFLIFVDATEVIVPRILGPITDGLADGSLDYKGLMYYVWLLIAVGLFAMLNRFLWRWFVNRTSRHADYQMRKMLFEKFTQLSERYYTQNKTGDLMAHATNDIRAVRESLGSGIVLTFDSLFLTIATTIMLFISVPTKLAVLGLLPFPMLAVAVFYFGKVINQRFKAVQESFSDLTDKAQESISGIRVIKGFAQEDFETDNFMKSAKNNFDKNVALMKVDAVFEPMINIFATLAFVIAIWQGGTMVARGDISLGSFVMFYSYLGSLVWPMIGMGWVINIIQRGMASAARLNKIFNEVPDIQDPPDAVEPFEIKGDITIRDLTFSYEKDGSRPVLKGLSADVKAGQVLAIVGRLGSGKSSLAAVLTRLYNPPAGTVFIDGIDINKIPISTLRKQIGCVPQESFLFSTTIRDNIAFSDPGIDDSEVEKYAKIAHIYKDVVDFPDKFNTMVGERGVTLSGGQKQRVSIARALIHNPKIVILDDCLSAVDTQTEESILKALNEELKGHTSIIISHRISTIKHADEIIVLDDGEVIERGRHEDLVEQGGVYSDMYRRQLLEEELAAL